MSMTATDFRAIAAVLADARAMASPYADDPQHSEYADGILDAVDRAATGIAGHCAARNRLFDRDRFLAECGIAPANDCITDVSPVV